MKIIRGFIFIFAASVSSVIAQNTDQGVVTGDVDITFQSNSADSTANQKTGLNAYLNAGFVYKGLEAGLRYEAFQPPLIGYKKALEGQGIAHRYISFTHQNFKVTAGNFYAQFGEGMVLRAYEARGLGLDNSLDGIKIQYSYKNKINLTALSGKQRHYFEAPDIFNSYFKDKSTIRGVDADVNVSELFKDQPKFIVNAGGSVVSRYFPGWHDAVAPDSLPPIVSLYSTRLRLQYKDFSIAGEYATKSLDPYPNLVGLDDSASRHAVLLTFNYTRKGFGATVRYKEISSFPFFSDPTTQGDIEYLANFLPPLPNIYEFRLFNKYPYQTQYAAEKGFQSELTWTPKRGKTFTGYYSQLYNLIHEKYFEEWALRAEWKLNSKIKTIAAYKYGEINAVRVLINPLAGYVFSNTAAAEVIYRITDKIAARTEIQYMSTKQDKGNWTYELLELTFAPHFTLAGIDEYNIGSTKDHYINALIKYGEGNSQFSLSYGKTAAGILCIGGVCRFVPAFNGFTFTVISKI